MTETSNLLTEEWINKLKDGWNETPEIFEKLADINFNSTIACGFQGEENPRCVFKVENGKAIHGGLYNNEELDWDMRASLESWEKWSKKTLGMTGMTMAVARGKLQFKKGDFKAMIKNPSMAGPFVKSFSLMTDI